MGICQPKAEKVTTTHVNSGRQNFFIVASPSLFTRHSSLSTCYWPLSPIPLPLATSTTGRSDTGHPILLECRCTDQPANVSLLYEFPEFGLQVADCAVFLLSSFIAGFRLKGTSLINVRRVTLTDSESGKYFWTSGANMTAPLPGVISWIVDVPSG